MFTPERLVIDGTKIKLSLPTSRKGPNTYYKICLYHGKEEAIILLPFRLFYIFGSLAILRDVTAIDSFNSLGSDQACGFVHRDELRLSKSTMNQYVYSVRLEIRKQLRQLHRDGKISIAESYNLTSWPVIESAMAFGQDSRWRLVMDPVGISITPRVLEFPDALFNKIGNAYFERHPSHLRVPH